MTAGARGKPAPAHPSQSERPAAPLRIPPSLRAGDRVALVSPSSHRGDDAAALNEEAVGILAGWGLQVDAPAPEEPRHLYLAGDDRLRAARFQESYCDPEVKALFLTRGGVGAARMVSLLERERIARAEPTWVVGFSDATALFAYLHAVAGVAVMHGPCLAAPSLLRSPARAESLEALRAALFEPDEGRSFPVQLLNPAKPPAAAISGRLVGGTLALVVTTLGTPWELETRGGILFLEEVNEAPYRIDRMITHLRTAGKFEGLRALLLGHLEKCDSDPPGLLEEVLQDLFGEAPFPVFRGLPAGHGHPNLALPLGRTAQLAPDGDAGVLLKIL